MLQKRITGTGAFAGKCLDVRGPSIEAGTPVQTWTCSNVEEMKWLFDGDGPIKGFGGNCATVAGAFRNGTPVEMHPCDGSTAQRWIGHGNGFIEAGSNMCLDIQGPLLDDGTPVQVWECDDSLDQHHWVVR